jgi:hypothetical protein
VVQLGCTNGEQHRWTVLRTFPFPQDAPLGEAAKWAPAIPGQPLAPRCPRCGRNPRLGRSRGGRLLAEAELRARAEGSYRLNVSLLPF